MIEDTKVITRSRNSKKKIHNTIYKRENSYQNTTLKTKVRLTRAPILGLCSVI